MPKIRQKLDRAEFAKLSADVQALYIPKGDGYVLDSDDAEELRTAHARTKEELKAAQERLEAVKGIDPVKYQELVETTAKASRQRDLDEKNYQKIIDEDKAAHVKELEKRDKKLDSVLGQLNEALVDRELVQAMSAYPGARTKLLLPAAQKVVAMREVNGKFRAVVLDTKGEPRLKEGAKDANDFMGPVELVAEMRNDKDYAGAFPANAPGRDVTRLVLPKTDGGQATTADMVNSIAKQVTDGATKLSA